MSKKKIFAIIPSASGHVNPICGLIKELCKEPNIECIFFGIDDHKELIEKTGATFRRYVHRNIADVDIPKLTERGKEPFFAKFFAFMIDCSYVLLPQLIKEYESEKPDMIIFDPSFIVVVYFIEILRSQKKQVKVMQFFPNFVLDKEMMESVPGLMDKSLKAFVAMGGILFKQFKLSWEFNMSIYNPFSLFTAKTPYTKIVAVFPELHPNVEKYDSTHKFVGQCVSEEARQFDWNSDPELKEFLDPFPIKDPNNQTTSDLKLILMSLGTVFHQNTFVFELVIQAFREYNQKDSRKFNASSKFKVVISLGEQSHKILGEKIAKKELILPEYILLRPKVPQLEILKRADLFITHCGMNSTSETIKYAVPIVAIPIEGDQHINSRRVCDQMTLGIRLEPLKMKVDEIGDAIDTVLSEEKFLKNIQDLSRISAKYDGKMEGKRIILEFLSQNSAINSIGSKSNQVKPL